MERGVVASDHPRVWPDEGDEREAPMRLARSGARVRDLRRTRGDYTEFTLKIVDRPSREETQP